MNPFCVSDGKDAEIFFGEVGDNREGDFAEPGSNRAGEWTPPGPGQATITARQIFAVTFWASGAVEAQPGERILDLCAAPGGKATGLASSGAIVIAADVRPRRAELVRENALRLDLELPVVVSDGLAPPFADGSFDAVLLDAPCTGLGALRRRADARWLHGLRRTDERGGGGG